MPKNLMGDERAPQPLTMKWEDPHITLYREGKFAGMVSPNGWTGKGAYIDWKIGEPVVTNLPSSMSLAEMQQVINFWEKHAKVTQLEDLPKEDLDFSDWGHGGPWYFYEGNEMDGHRCIATIPAKPGFMPYWDGKNWTWALKI